MSIEPPDYPEALSGEDTEYLFWAIRRAIAELEAAHWPESFAAAGPRSRCMTCAPKEPVWPCVARMVADDLRVALDEVGG